MLTFHNLWNFLSNKYLTNFVKYQNDFLALVIHCSKIVKSPGDFVFKRDLQIDFECAFLLNLIDDFLINLKPIEYIMNKKHFFGLDFYVDERVLIPRNDTESVLATFISHVRKFITKDQYFLDLGTGSGCLAIALSKQFSECSIIASDISKEALKVAKINQAKHFANNVTLIEANFLDVLKKINHHIDYLICNPPYVDTNDCHLEKGVLKHEPSIALFANSGGLQYYELLFNELQTNLDFQPKVITCELHEYLADQISFLANNLQKKYNVTISLDLNQAKRAITLVKK